MKQLLTIIVALVIVIIQWNSFNRNRVNRINNEAVMEMRSKNYDAAIQKLDSALKIDKNNYTVRYNLALCYHDIGKCDKLSEEFETIKTLDKDNPNNYIVEGLDYGCRSKEIINSVTKNGKFSKKSLSKLTEYLKKENSSYQKFFDTGSSGEYDDFFRKKIEANNELIKVNNEVIGSLK